MSMLNRHITDYGECSECGSPLHPVWFTDYERDKCNRKTGRKRSACSHLTCWCCFRNYPIDDTFDDEWR